jgi:hypothetical protein
MPDISVPQRFDLAWFISLPFGRTGSNAGDLTNRCDAANPDTID